MVMQSRDEFPVEQILCMGGLLVIVSKTWHQICFELYIAIRQDIWIKLQFAAHAVGMEERRDCPKCNCAVMEILLARPALCVFAWETNLNSLDKIRQYLGIATMNQTLHKL